MTEPGILPYRRFRRWIPGNAAVMEKSAAASRSDAPQLCPCCHLFVFILTPGQCSSLSEHSPRKGGVSPAGRASPLRTHLWPLVPTGPQKDCFASAECHLSQWQLFTPGKNFDEGRGATGAFGSEAAWFLRGFSLDGTVQPPLGGVCVTGVARAALCKMPPPGTSPRSRLSQTQFTSGGAELTHFPSPGPIMWRVC